MQTQGGHQKSCIVDWLTEDYQYERLAKLDPLYMKNEYNMISHIFANLPQKLCMDIITTM
jgi:hypothetical protein